MHAPRGAIWQAKRSLSSCRLRPAPRSLSRPPIKASTGACITRGASP